MTYVEWYNFEWPRFNSWAFIRHVGYFARGIYVIWYWDHFGHPRKVKVGKGYIRNNLQADHSDPDIQRHAYRRLIVSWTPILLEYDRRRVERYISDARYPMVGVRFPSIYSLPVNLPWEDISRYNAIVTAIIDGDTFIVQYDSGLFTEMQRIRLENINTPEKGEPFASAATNYLRSLIHNQVVTIEKKGLDHFGRIRAHVWRTRDGLAINRAMVNNGYSNWITYP